MNNGIMLVSQEEFENKIKTMSFSALKQLITEIVDLTQGNIADHVLADLLRKETKIWKELQSRQVWTKMNQKAYNQFIQWRYKDLKYRKKLY
jgi:hypothetical protein